MGFVLLETLILISNKHFLGLKKPNVADNSASI